MNNFKAEGFQAITPYLTLKNLKDFIDFAEKGLGAKTVSKMDQGDGTIVHAELKFDDSNVMAGEAPNESFPAMLYFYVKDCDKSYSKAIEAGASSLMEPKDQPYGDRNAAVKDKWGNQWWFATHKETVSNEEIMKKMKNS